MIVGRSLPRCDADGVVTIDGGGPQFLCGDGFVVAGHGGSNEP